MFEFEDKINNIKLAAARTVIDGLKEEAIEKYNIFAEQTLPLSDFGAAMLLGCGSVQLYHGHESDQFLANVIDRVRKDIVTFTIVDYSDLRAIFDKQALADLAGIAFAEMEQSEKLSKRWSLL
ncbi:hypothetical protein [Methylobacter sp. YRD-M1]|uniref:hypothetical protein n=1 Tax=Methylobacter sp. YRD-M1 TaxID=2911520 RepID=UPI00227A60BF|nr:hypothetical protein [Methylobacter sp. YRD-M1]WAK01844.1 hypothetical protein LZ558_18825 [Methylobacter sp. YRD-M1]